MSLALVATGLFAAVALALVSDSGTCDIQVASSDDNDFCFLTPGVSGADSARVDYIGSTSDTQSSGTGIFDPFVRLQGSPTEKGFNTNGAVQDETKAGKWTHAIMVNAIPIINLGGVDYWELFVDINEGNSTKQISLNAVEIYFTSDPLLTNYPFSAAEATPVYDFAGSILINDVNQGSGRGDLRYLVPLTNVTFDATRPWFVLYSEWGAPAGTAFASDGGFEEWKVKKVPPPPSLILDKVVVRDNGGTAPESSWTLTATGAGPSPTNLSGPGAAGSTDVVSTGSFKADTYTLAESGSVAGYTNGTTYSCVKTPAGGVAGAPVVSNTITLASGDSAICTITNNDNPPSLTLDKVVVSDNGGTAAESSWNLTATGALASPTNLSGPGAAGSADVVSGASFKADTYTLAETGTVAGYTNGTTYSCVKTPAGGAAGAPVVSNSITLNNGDSAVCTITNTDNKSTPVIKTAQGWVLFDTANFTGIVPGAPDAASATVTFKLWSDAACTVQVGTDRVESISGGSATTSTGIVVSPTTSPATFYWTADYSGDQFNNAVSSACGTETTTISWVQPAP